MDFEIGDKVEHTENAGLFGIIGNIGENLMGYTTYFVKWDNHCMNYQWTQRIKHANCAQLAKEV